jgi:hypothetical protein
MRRLALLLLLLLARGAPTGATAPHDDVGVRLSGCAAAGVGAAVCDAGPLLPSPTLSHVVRRRAHLLRRAASRHRPAGSSM